MYWKDKAHEAKYEKITNFEKMNSLFVYVLSARLYNVFPPCNGLPPEAFDNI